MTTIKKSKSKSKKATKKPAAKETATLLDKALFADLLSHVRVASKASAIDRRKEVLALVAGSIAAALVTSPTPSIASPAGIATAAIDIAVEILKKAGSLVESPTKTETFSVTNDEERYAKIRDFLMTEWARPDNRRLIGVDLLYVPGQGYRDEPIRSWECADEPEFFAEAVNVEKLIESIIALATVEADNQVPGQHRFVVRTRQHLGSRMAMSFALYVSAVGAAS